MLLSPEVRCPARPPRSLRCCTRGPCLRGLPVPPPGDFSTSSGTQDLSTPPPLPAPGWGRRGSAGCRHPFASGSKNQQKGNRRNGEADPGGVLPRPVNRRLSGRLPPGLRAPRAVRRAGPGAQRGLVSALRRPGGTRRIGEGEVVEPGRGPWGRGGRGEAPGLRGAGSRDAELPGGSPEARGRSQPVAGRVCSAGSARGRGPRREEERQLVSGWGVVAGWGEGRLPGGLFASLNL